MLKTLLSNQERCIEVWDISDVIGWHKHGFWQWLGSSHRFDFFNGLLGYSFVKLKLFLVRLDPKTFTDLLRLSPIDLRESLTTKCHNAIPPTRSDSTVPAI